MRDVGGVRKSIHQSWLAKGLGLGLGLLCWGLREFRKRFQRKKPVLFKSGQWHFYQDNAPVHNSIIVTGYLTKMGIKTVPHTPYSWDLAPCDFWLFPKLRGFRYETIEEMKEAVMKVIDMLTQEDFHGTFQKLLKRYNKCIATRGDYFKGGKSFMYVLSIKKPIQKSLETYRMHLINIYIYIYIWKHLWCNGYNCWKRIWCIQTFESWMKLFAFYIVLTPLGKVYIQLLSLQLWVNSRAGCAL